MKRILVALTLMSVSGSAYAESVYWGPKHYMSAKVISKSSVGTDHAKIIVRFKAKPEGAQSVLRANCREKTFTGMDGGRFKVDGASIFFEAKSANGEILYSDTGPADYLATTFRALCGSRSI
jgi:hypothetical protein